MHDPMFVAFSVRRPWPQKAGGPTPKGPRWEWRPGSPFATVAGRRLYFPGLVTVWHNEPGGRDSGEVCGYPHGWALRKHLSHLSLQVHPLQAFRRWAFTRCSWCGGPSRKGDYINLRAPGGLAEKGRKHLPWWAGEQGLLHRDCSTVADGWRHCVCPEPDLRQDARGYGWSWCSLCGKSRWNEDPEDKTAIYLLIRRRSNRGERPDPELIAEVRAMWDQRRAAREAVEAAEEILKEAER